jgi:hypothetical protein
MVFATCFRAESCLGKSPTSSVRRAVSTSTSGVLARDKCDDMSEDVDGAWLVPYVFASAVFTREELSEDDSVSIGWRLSVIFKQSKCWPMN